MRQHTWWQLHPAVTRVTQEDIRRSHQWRENCLSDWRIDQKGSLMILRPKWREPTHVIRDLNSTSSEAWWFKFFPNDEKLQKIITFVTSYRQPTWSKATWNKDHGWSFLDWSRANRAFRRTSAMTGNYLTAHVCAIIHDDIKLLMTLTVVNVNIKLLYWACMRDRP